MNLSFIKNPKFRKGSAATLVTVLVLAVLIVLNVLVSALSDRFSLRLDTTANKAYTLSDQSLAFLAGLEQDVYIYVLSTEEGFVVDGTYLVQINQVIRNYAQASGRVTLTYVDPVRDPSAMARFSELEPSQGDIIVRCGERMEKLNPYDLLNLTATMTGGYYVESSRAEQVMTSAILNVSSESKVTVTVLTGHGEAAPEENALATFVSLLQANNYNVISQNLLTEEIDPGAAVALICAPMRDYDENVLRKLDAWLADTGEMSHTLFFIDSPNQPQLPNLHAFLADWGIGVGDGFVYENNQNMWLGLYPYVAVVSYTEDHYAEEVLHKQLPMVTPYSRPLEVLFESGGSKTVQALLQYSETAAVQPLDWSDEEYGNDWVPERWGPFPALILSQEYNYEGGGLHYGNVLAVGTTEVIASDILQNPNRANASYLVNVLNELAEREDVFVIEDKTLGGSYMDVSGVQVITFGLLFVIVLPLAVLVFGIVLWMRRRHR